MNPKPQVGEALHLSLETRISQNKKRAGEEEGNQKFAFVISTGSEDRHETIIKPEGGDFTAYLQNRVVLFNHNYGAVIGRALGVEVKGGKVIAQMEFDEDNEFASEVKGQVERGFLNATSIGFIVKKWSFNEDTDTQIIEEWELVEFSIVSVPSNRDALITSRNMLAVAAMTKEITELKNMVSVLVGTRQTEPLAEEQEIKKDAKTADETEDQNASNDAISLDGNAEGSQDNTGDSPGNDAIPVDNDDTAHSGDDQSSLEEEPVTVAPRAATQADYMAIVASMMPRIRTQVRRELGKE
ncbi:HK97 family phage prohead protease [bacterium]|nr:HK97 family phage prohead protease [bacterium]